MQKLKNILQTRNKMLPMAKSKITPEKREQDPVLQDLSTILDQAISLGELKSYSDLADKIDGSKLLTSKHYMRGSRLREKALDEMALHDFSDTMRTDYNRSRYEVQRSIMLAHVLKIKGIGTEAISIWLKTLRKAIRYSLTSEAYVCAQHLCYEYAFRRKYAKHYNMIRTSKRLLSAMEAEHEAALIYHRLVLLMKGKWYISPAYIQLTRHISNRISKLAGKFRTHELYSMHYRARFYFHYASHDYRALMDACRKYHAYLMNHKQLRQNSRWAEIALHQMNGAMSLGNYNIGINVAEANRKFMRPENPNWFSYLENYFQLLMNAGQYMKAKELYGEVMVSAHRKNMSQQQVDIWKVFLAYVQLALHSSGMISRFKPRQHFSVLTTCKSDKVGLNFLIESGMLIYMLIQAKRGDLDKHGERFKKYVKRHIVKSLMPRHYLFSKMLMVAVRHHHRSPAYIERNAFKYYQLLKNAVAVKPHDFEANELIRFEQLWLMLIDQLSLHPLKESN
ncbi:MAG: hypothetical protein ABI763_08650 [Bacteroidota bacterium]